MKKPISDKTHIENNHYFIRKNFYKYLIPSILSILGGNISIMIDNCVAGKVLGENALAAMSLVNPMFNIITAFGLLIGGGAATLASVSIGSNDLKKKHTFFTASIYLTIIMGMLFLTMLFFIEPIIRILGADGELLIMAKDYCIPMIAGSVTLMFVYIPLNFFRIEGMGRIGMFMFFLMSFLDIVLDVLFVPIFKWGMFGLSLATVLSCLIAVAVVFPKLLSKQMGYRFVKIENPMIAVSAMLHRGSPLALGNLYTVIRVRVLNGYLLSCGGSLALAAYGCANNVIIIGMAFVSGIAQTVGPIVGVLYGERDGNGIKNTSKWGVTLGCGIMTALAILFIVFSRPLVLLFGLTNPEQIKVAQTAIMILSINLILGIFSGILTYCYTVCGHTGRANLMTLLKGLALPLLLIPLGATLMGVVGVLFSIVISEAITVLFMLIAWIFGKNAEYDSILLLSRKRFEHGQSLVLSVPNDPNEITEAASRSSIFCEEAGLTPKQAMTVSLGVEEMMNLLSKYAVLKNKELIEYRLFISPLETVVRIRCSGKWFNPLCFEPEDEFDNLGVKMMLKMAKDMTYSTNLGMNNIQIVI